MHTIRYQVDGRRLSVESMAGAKRQVRAQYPGVRFTTEEDRVACEDGGDLVASIAFQGAPPPCGSASGDPCIHGNVARSCRGNR